MMTAPRWRPLAPFWRQRAAALAARPVTAGLLLLLLLLLRSQLIQFLAGSRGGLGTQLGEQQAHTEQVGQVSGSFCTCTGGVCAESLPAAATTGGAWSHSDAVPTGAQSCLCSMARAPARPLLHTWSALCRASGSCEAGWPTWSSGCRCTGLQLQAAPGMAGGLEHFQTQTTEQGASALPAGVPCAAAGSCQGTRAAA